MLEFEIDGKKITVEEGASIIEAADKEGIYIPRFCYHKKLSVAANCRMCLVEVEKSGKPLPACATPVTAGMKVFTHSQKTIEAQRAVMGFLLINHPLDCPICDQGGECELQDLAMGFGRSYSNYEETKRAVFSNDIGPLIETEMTRCIQCTRCVRFGEEIAGLPELGVVNRGEKEAISTYAEHFIQSELSGNVIDICPVGALTDKPARYRGRGWEFSEHPVISPHDGVGSNIFLHTRWQEFSPHRMVMRAVPRENEAVNETWISDRDRFSHFGLYHDSRIYEPQIKIDGKWIKTSWEKALETITEKIKTLINKYGASEIGALASPSLTVEEYYLLQKWCRKLGSHHIDHRVRWQDFRDEKAFPTFPGLGFPITDIEHLNAIMLLGSNVRFEQPLISHRIHKACLEGAKVLAINPMDYSFVFNVDEKIITSPLNLIDALNTVFNDSTHPMAQVLQNAERAAIFLGEHALHHEDASQIRRLAYLIAEKYKATVGFLTEGANSAGAWLTGAIPHRLPGGELFNSPGFNAREMLTTHPLKAYVLMGLEPELDCAYAEQARLTLSKAEFVLSLTTFSSPAMQSYADVLLPIAPFSESGGTFVNIEGQWQSFSAAAVPEGNSQPGWKVLRALGSLFQFTGFDYNTIQEVQSAIPRKPVQQTVFASDKVDSSFAPLSENNSKASSLTRLAPWPMVRVDSLVRRSPPLQATLADRLNNIRLNSKTASRLNFNEGDLLTAVQAESRITLPLVIDERLADNTVFLAAGLEETAGFGRIESAITLEKGA